MLSASLIYNLNNIPSPTGMLLGYQMHDDNETFLDLHEGVA